MTTRSRSNHYEVTRKTSAALLLTSSLILLSSCGTSSVDTSGPPSDQDGYTPGVWQDDWEGQTMYETAFPLEEETVFDAQPERVVLAPWVKVLDPAKQQAISSIESDRVIFDAAGNEDLLALESMEVVSSIREDAVFLRRVIAVEQQGDKIVMHTTQASIPEAIISGSFDLGSAPTGMMNPAGEMRQQPLNGYANQKQFKAELNSNRFSIEAELPLNGNYSITPNFAVNVERELEANFAFQADIDMAGARRMCEDLVEANDPSFRRTFPWFGEVQEYPPELLQLAWALEWAGNTRTGMAGDIDLHWLGLGGSTYTTYHGTSIYQPPSTGYAAPQYIEEPIDYVQMRPEFIEATTSFGEYVRENNLTQFFDMSGPYARVQGGATRAEIISRYRAMLPNLQSNPREMLETYIAILERQSNLDWLNTALVVARHHCQGVTSNSQGKSSVKTTVGVEGGFKIKRASNVGVSDEALTSRGFTKNSTTGMFRKNLVDAPGRVQVFWIGWFPVVVRPVFQLAFLFKAPEVSAEYDFHYGPYQIVMEGGYNRGSGGTVPQGSMTQSATCGESDAGLCGGLSSPSAGDMTFISRTGSVSLETEAQIAPEFIARFYEVAGVGVGVPVYGNVKATIVGRGEANTSQGGIARGNICVGAKAGLKVNLFGRLNDPFSTHDGPDAQIQSTLYDSCASDSFIPCAKASVGLSAGVSGGNPAYVDPVYNWGDDQCPQDKLEIRLQWNEETDLDLAGIEPSGDQLSYRSNAVTRNDGNHTSGAECKDGNGQTIMNCSAETLVWGKTIGAVTPGTYQFWVTNEDGAAASNATIQVIRTRAAGGEPEIQNFNVSLPAQRDAESQRFSVEID